MGRKRGQLITNEIDDLAVGEADGDGAAGIEVVDESFAVTDFETGYATDSVRLAEGGEEALPGLALFDGDEGGVANGTGAVQQRGGEDGEIEDIRAWANKRAGRGDGSDALLGSAPGEFGGPFLGFEAALKRFLLILGQFDLHRAANGFTASGFQALDCIGDALAGGDREHRVALADLIGHALKVVDGVVEGAIVLGRSDEWEQEQCHYGGCLVTHM
jgi:hypothetical protein